jgi:hypothetical protein
MLQGAWARSVVRCLVVAALVGAAAACGGGSPAPSAATTHPGTAPATTASPTVTPNPGQAAIAAVQRMFSAYNAMLKSGSSKAYRLTFTKECSACLADAQSVDSVYRKGRQVAGGQTTLAKLHAAGDYQKLQLIVVEGNVTQAAAKILDGKRVIDRFEAGQAVPVAWNVKRISGRWLVTRETELQ